MNVAECNRHPDQPMVVEYELAKSHPSTLFTLKSTVLEVGGNGSFVFYASIIVLLLQCTSVIDYGVNSQQLM